MVSARILLIQETDAVLKSLDAEKVPIDESVLDTVERVRARVLALETSILGRAGSALRCADYTWGMHPAHGLVSDDDAREALVTELSDARAGLVREVNQIMRVVDARDKATAAAAASGPVRDALVQNNSMSLYRVLNLKPSATPAEIKAAYMSLMLELHPDRQRAELRSEHQKADSLKRFLAVREAYDTLGDARRRREYDQSRSWLGTASATPSADTPKPARPSADFSSWSETETTNHWRAAERASDSRVSPEENETVPRTHTQRMWLLGTGLLVLFAGGLLLTVRRGTADPDTRKRREREAQDAWAARMALPVVGDTAGRYAPPDSAMIVSSRDEPPSSQDYDGPEHTHAGSLSLDPMVATYVNSAHKRNMENAMLILRKDRQQANKE
ncbi:DnaJ sub C member 7 [Entophlyctis luteolus]|nr:DnaJ sub C member 7 [Entophlyctis luteolus]